MANEQNESAGAEAREVAEFVRRALTGESDLTDSDDLAIELFKVELDAAAAKLIAVLTAGGKTMVEADGVVADQCARAAVTRADASLGHLGLDLDYECLEDLFYGAFASVMGLTEEDALDDLFEDVREAIALVSGEPA